MSYHAEGLLKQYVPTIALLMQIKENKSIAIAINEGARRRSRSNKSKRSTKECLGLLGKKERWVDGDGDGGMFI